MSFFQHVIRNICVLSMVLGFMAFVSLTSASQGFAQTDDVSGAESGQIQSVITDQLQAFQSGDHARAYTHAAPNVKSIFPNLDHFTTMVKRGYGAIYSPDFYKFGRSMRYNGELYQEVFVTDQAGKQWQAVYTLKMQADGSWKITGVKMEPFKATST